MDISDHGVEIVFLHAFFDEPEIGFAESVPEIVAVFAEIIGGGNVAAFA